jgi:hypothetical protein
MRPRRNQLSVMSSIGLKVISKRENIKAIILLQVACSASSHNTDRSLEKHLIYSFQETFYYL